MKKGNARPAPFPSVSMIVHRFSDLMSHFHANARETVAALVGSIIFSGSLGQTNLAAHLPCGSSFSARIKRVQRFFSRTHINLDAFWTDWTRRVCSRYLGTGQRARIAFDWTVEGRGALLCAMLVVGGRGIPLMCRGLGYDGKSQGMAEREIELARAVREAVPDDVTIVWLMDRGFSNARMLTLVQLLANSHYVIRAKGALKAQTQRQKELLRNWNPRARKTWFHRDVRIGNGGAVTTNLVLTPNFKGEHDAQWILLTDLEDTRDIRELYSARWAIEAQFRDLKSEIGLVAPRYMDCTRVERLMVLAAMAMELALDEGTRNKGATRRPRDWEAQQRMVKRRSHVPLLSVFLLGLASLRVRLAGPPGRSLSDFNPGGVS